MPYQVLRKLTGKKHKLSLLIKFKHVYDVWPCKILTAWLRWFISCSCETKSCTWIACGHHIVVFYKNIMFGRVANILPHIHTLNLLQRIKSSEV
jgi:hypothetical protein